MKLMLAGVVAAVFVALGLAYYFTRTKPINVTSVSSFEECVEAGYSVTKGDPDMCLAPDGRRFVRFVGNAGEYVDQIVISMPTENQVVRSPLMIEGRARGPWYFEANFPIDILDEDGTLLGTAVAQAQGEWMTEEFVPFKAQLEYSTPLGRVGKIIVRNSNASGLPENDKSVIIPVKFDISSSQDPTQN